MNYKFDSDVDDFIETYEKKVESHILNYLGLLTEGEGLLVFLFVCIGLFVFPTLFFSKPSGMSGSFEF